MARAGEVLAAPGRLAFWGSHALTPGHIEPRRGRAIKAWGGGFRGILAGGGLSLPQQAKHAAGEDFRQLLAALDGSQVGRHGGSSWFLDCDAHASPIRLSMPAGGRIVRVLGGFSKSVGQRRQDCRRSSSLPIPPREARPWLASQLCPNDAVTNHGVGGRHATHPARISAVPGWFRLPDGGRQLVRSATLPCDAFVECPG